MIVPAVAAAFAERVIAAGATEVAPDTGDVIVTVGAIFAAAFAAPKATCGWRAMARAPNRIKSD